MKCEHISLVIDSICKKLGIKYDSINPHHVSLQRDIQQMSGIYLQLKEIMGTIQEIENRHNINGLKNKFDDLIKHLDESDHDVIRLARELKKENVY